MPDNQAETTGRTFDTSFQVDERGVVGPQALFKLSKADFFLLTKGWSRLNYWAQFALAMVITNVVTISSKSLTAQKLTVEPWQWWFLGVPAGAAALLFFLGSVVFNPKKKIVKRIEQFFEDYEYPTKPIAR